MRRGTYLLALALSTALLAGAQPKLDPGWKPLFNGKNLDGWEIRGTSLWSVMPDGVLVGQRAHPAEMPFITPWPVDEKTFRFWLGRQSWLYTRREFTNFDLHVEYWIGPGGNSGVSIRDRSRAHYAVGELDSARPDLAKFPKSTPAHIGYEIQIIDDDKEVYPTGSVYLFKAAKTGLHRPGNWNTLDIESRANLIRVLVNGQEVAQSPGDPARSKTGPIGLQLHDQFSMAMFRNIRIRER